MSSVKLKFRPSSLQGKQGVIYYQVIHDRQVRQIRTGYHIYTNEWDDETSFVVSCSNGRETYISRLAKTIEWDLKRINHIIGVLEKEGVNYTSEDIIETFTRKSYEHSLFAFMRKIIEQLKMAGRYRTSETYTSALHSFSSFRGDEDVLLEEIDSNMIIMYESYLKGRELTRNTTSFYMRILRAVYNRAVETGLVHNVSPFKHVYTGIDKTFKRALLLEDIKSIRELKLKSKPLDFARDMFLFSFYTRGMSFIDMAYLTKKNINNGMLVYQRRKTGRRLCIHWEDCMQGIVDKYYNDTEGYLLPILKKSKADIRKQYKYALLYIDRNLKKIADMAKIDSALTLYVARHSWASIAKSKNIPVSVISEALGHESEETTNIYLSSLDNSLIDDANRNIINSIL